MVEFRSYRDVPSDNSAIDLLYSDEVVLIVDDAPEIALILGTFVERLGLPCLKVNCATELYELLALHKIALVLLDIGLPDENGIDVLKKIAPTHPDLGIIMVTGTTDINIALECLREGADDYLTKPVSPSQFNYTVSQTLKKRRLAIDNRLYHEELQLTNFRTQFLHQLNLKLNSAYLSTIELNEVLHALLVGITSKEGLQFNRAFLALFDEDQSVLFGRLGIGPARREDANRLWNNIQTENLSLQKIIDEIISGNIKPDVEINEIIQQLEVPVSDTEHLLIKACNVRQSINVKDGHALSSHAPHELINLLSSDNFVITPLYSPSKSLGVIIADNFVTNKPILEEDIQLLEIFASQASLAIEQSHLYRQMQLKINELELTTRELDRSKDLLLEAERFSTLGHMSAQLVHAIRNPVTALGGTARLLEKRIDDPAIHRFLQIIVDEASKVESILEDLFHYVDKSELTLSPYSLKKLVRKSLMVFYTSMQNHNISSDIRLHDDSFILIADLQKIRQTFHHLIKNSIEAMEHGGQITITSRIIEDQVEITFTDSGSGVESENISKATDAFFTTKTYGTGMGLTLVKQIIKMHNGSFELRENEDFGTSAIVRLPAGTG